MTSNAAAPAMTKQNTSDTKEKAKRRMIDILSWLNGAPRAFPSGASYSLDSRYSWCSRALSCEKGLNLNPRLSAKDMVQMKVRERRRGKSRTTRHFLNTGLKENSLAKRSSLSLSKGFPKAAIAARPCTRPKRLRQAEGRETTYCHQTRQPRSRPTKGVLQGSSPQRRPPSCTQLAIGGIPLSTPGRRRRRSHHVGRTRRNRFVGCFPIVRRDLSRAPFQVSTSQRRR